MEIEISKLNNIRRQLGTLTTLGLPIADNLFWSDPGPKLGGLLAFRLMNSQPSSDGVYSIDLRPEVRAFKRLSDLNTALRREHSQKYWYRGQRRRYEARYQGMIPRLQENFQQIKSVEFVLDSIMPSKYRSITIKQPAVWASAPPPGQPLDDFAAPLRAILSSNRSELKTLFLTAIEAMAMDSIRLSMTEQVELTWGGRLVAPGTNTSKALATLISVAQHYEYGSVMVDVTRSIDVALSFATHDWVSGARETVYDSEGIVYRFDQEALDRAVQNLLKGGLRSYWFRSLAILGMTDIHDVGFDLERPFLQEGGSIFGFETAAAHFVMQAFQAMVAFTFEEDDLDAQAVRNLATLRPERDPGLEIFNSESRAKTHPFDHDELEAAMRAFGIDTFDIQRIIGWRKSGLV